MTETILTNLTASITEFKVNPMQIIDNSDGEPVAILNRNKTAFYCVPSDLYEKMMEFIEDAELTKVVKQRVGQKEVKVNINDL